MLNIFEKLLRRMRAGSLFCLVWAGGHPWLQANPTGGTVTQGSVSFSSSGSTFTVNQSSANAYINWNSFNIGAGETTTFVQPTSSSVTWNHINDANPSQILGNLNANGYVILQNQNGFYVGGSAVLNAHGLIMTTAAAATPNLDSGGAWSFSAPPPQARIINYGKINLTDGGSGFLIASDIVNNGTISAPDGKIGLYAGEKVLVSMSPDGRGLSSELTLPTGSVDNEGHLIADGGTIAAQAQTVNQNGLVQANSIQNVNGVIELIASDAVNLGANSAISAQGGASGVSAGGSVTIKSGNTFSDQTGSVINVAGGVQGGNGGEVEISASQMGALESRISGGATTGYTGGKLLIDPTDVLMDDAYVAGLNDQISGGLSEIDVTADEDIELSTVWSTVDAGSSTIINLVAGRNITLDDGSGIMAGQNVSLNLDAGKAFSSAGGQLPASGSYGIYLDGSAFIQTLNGNITLSAVNEVQVGWEGSNERSVNAGQGSITTIAGGSISVTTQFGDVNSGSSPFGFDYNADTAPYYTVASDDGLILGGISTGAGGDVTIKAGGNVYSYLPSTSSPNAVSDGGSGAFGSEPGDVTITAGGSIYGHYVLANGVGDITATAGNIGAAAGNPFALSLIAGTWNVNAGAGNIFLQEVRNPNGVFNFFGGSPVNHLFNYDPQAAVDLTANGVYLTGLNTPRPDGNVQVIYPPILDITAGSGGVTLQGNVTLFPSPYQSLDITTTDGGNLMAAASSLTAPVQLLMSDSSKMQWTTGAFGSADHGSTPVTLDNPNPVKLDISGSMENLNLITTKATQVSVGGDMLNCGFSGENLHAGDVTSIKVAGQIYNQSAYTFVTLASGIPPIPAADLPPGYASSWDSIFTLALNPNEIANLQVPANILPSGLSSYVLANAALFSTRTVNGQLVGINPGFVYNPATGQLGFGGPMTQTIESEIGQTFTVLHFVNGLPQTYTGPDGKTHFVTDQISWAPTTAVQTLYAASQGDSNPNSGQLGYRIGGPGEFDISAGSISLGNSYGILSCGVYDPQGGFGRYQNLTAETPSGATVNVVISGDLDMVSSTIAAIGGGDVNVRSLAGSMDLGFTGIANTFRQIGYGVFNSGLGNVNVEAFGNVNIDGSRIATYNGGNITITSDTKNVEVGSGGDTFTGVQTTFINPVTGKPQIYSEDVFGSGIVADTLLPGPAASFPPSSLVATKPGNITVNTPQGDIVASLGGITQEALDGSSAAGPTINLTAGTPASGTKGNPDYFPGYVGNIDLGQSGVIGGTVNATASGNISGLIISRQNSNINAVQTVTVTVLAGGSANVKAGGNITGTIIGVTGVDASSGGSLSASLLGQSVTGNGLAQNTLGSSASATATSQSAAQAANEETKQQTTADTSNDDDTKKHKKLPALQKLKRVTVLLSSASPR